MACLSRDISNTVNSIQSTGQKTFRMEKETIVRSRVVEIG